MTFHTWLPIYAFDHGGSTLQAQLGLLATGSNPNSVLLHSLPTGEGNLSYAQFLADATVLEEVISLGTLGYLWSPIRSTVNTTDAMIFITITLKGACLRAAESQESVQLAKL